MNGCTNVNCRMSLTKPLQDARAVQGGDGVVYTGEDTGTTGGVHLPVHNGRSAYGGNLEQLRSGRQRQPSIKERLCDQELRLVDAGASGYNAFYNDDVFSTQAVAGSSQSTTSFTPDSQDKVGDVEDEVGFAALGEHGNSMDMFDLEHAFDGHGTDEEVSKMCVCGVWQYITMVRH
jgi:hypothetical protein